MSNQNWFKDWFSSPYYHQLYQHRDESEAFAFIGTLIQHLKPIKNTKMLDVACGKEGTVLLWQKWVLMLQVLIYLFHLLKKHNILKKKICILST